MGEEGRKKGKGRVGRKVERERRGVGREEMEKRKRKGRVKGPLRTHCPFDGDIEKNPYPWGIRRINGGSKITRGQLATCGY